ncbi:MAG: hypothetical protein LUD14_02765 [Clostridiales bacterium]|nr:hypothetical protein [Clostridiales bacterium]
MAYEKRLNEIYAAISLEYLWPEYRPFFVKSESPDWINETMDFGLEVSQALLPDDGQMESVIERYLGCRREELPQSVFERYGERLHFYNNRFWAILPDETKEQDYLYKAKYRFDRKLEKLNKNYRRCRKNGLYLFLHPKEKTSVDAEALFDYMKQRQASVENGFDWVFLNCTSVIYVCDFENDRVDEILLPQNAELFLASEAERLRQDYRWQENDAIHIIN